MFGRDSPGGNSPIGIDMYRTSRQYIEVVHNIQYQPAAKPITMRARLATSSSRGGTRFRFRFRFRFSFSFRFRFRFYKSAAFGFLID